MKLYIGIALGVLAIIFLFARDTIFDKESTNSTVKVIYDNSMIIGIVLACVSLYLLYSAYSGSRKTINKSNETTEESDTKDAEKVETELLKEISKSGKLPKGY